MTNVPFMMDHWRSAVIFERQLIHLTHKPSMSMRGKGDLIHWPPKEDITNKFQGEEKPALNTWVAQEFYVLK